MTRILIVDDQPAFRRQLRRLLVRAGMTVVGEAGDIVEARNRVLDLQPDLAILDVILPGESGLDGLPSLKALSPDLRVIVVSAQSDCAGEISERAIEAGGEAFFTKEDLDLELVQQWARIPTN